MDGPPRDRLPNIPGWAEYLEVFRYSRDSKTDKPVVSHKVMATVPTVRDAAKPARAKSSGAGE